MGHKSKILINLSAISLATFVGLSIIKDNSQDIRQHSKHDLAKNHSPSLQPTNNPQLQNLKFS